MHAPDARSIYATFGPLDAAPTPEARQERRRIRKHRLARRPEANARPIERNRRAQLDAVLSCYRHGPLGEESPLAPLLRHVRAEVEALEQAVDAPPDAPAPGPAVRAALELLRAFGHMSVLDFSDVPVEERPLLVQILALEHRWCYAAAGTSRDAFKLATGRTGAR